MKPNISNRFSEDQSSLSSAKTHKTIQKYEPRKIPDTQKISPVIRENRPGFSVSLQSPKAPCFTVFQNGAHDGAQGEF